MDDAGEESRATRRQVLQAFGGALAVGTLPGRGTAQASGTIVYVGSWDSRLYAVDAESGNELWRYTRPGKGVCSSPTVADGTVYVGSNDDSLYAVDAATGTEEWAFTAPDSWVSSSPTVVDGVVYVGSEDGALYAVDAATGTQEWVFTQPADNAGSSAVMSNDDVDSSPAVAEGTVYIGSDDGTLYAVDASTGEQVWSTNIGGAVDSSPTVVDGTLYVGSSSTDPDDGTLYAADVGSGELEWAFTHPSNWVRSSPTVYEGTVYVGSADETLYAVDADSGDREWSFTHPDASVRSSPTVVDGTLYVGSHDGSVYALDADSGDREWVFDGASDWVYSSPTVHDSTVYVGSNDNTLYAVDAVTGDQNWTYGTLDDVKSSPTVVEDPQNGDSVGSRVLLGTLGHHEDGTDQVGVTGPSPSSFAVSIEETIVTQAGETLEVTVRVENTGEIGDTQTITLSVPELGDDSTEVALDGGGSTTKTLSLKTSEGDADEYTVTVQAGDADDETTETVSVSESLQSSGGDDSTTAPDSGDEPGAGGLGTTEMAAIGGGGGLALLLGVYALVRRSGEDDDTETDSTETSTDPDTSEPDSEPPEAQQQPDDGAVDGIDASLDDAASELDEAATALDRNSVRSAEETLDGVAEILDTARDSLDEQELPELTDRLDSLDHRHEQLQQRVDDERMRVPTTVPGAPRCSLSYSDIERRGELGRGGNADLYRATVTTDRRTVDIAVKEPRMGGETLDTEAVEGMIDEAETWQQLDDNDHIASVVDYGSHPLPWIAIEYMDGGHLGERAGDLPVEQALWTAAATTNGVRHAHRHGVAHLDLKPENILFRSVEDAWDVPKVADWGLSKHLLEHSKSVEELSPHYAAPEQFDDSYGSTDDVTDIYQLGAVFYELFTGQRPFEGPPARVMNRVLTEEPEPPSAVAAVPSALDEVLTTALAREKSERYESVLYLRDDLQELRESL